jgi:hypothetical protein
MELCSQGKHFDFMRTYYGPEMVSVEADGKEYVGKETVIHKSEVFQGNNAISAQDLRGPFFLGSADGSSGQFAVYTSIDFTPRKGGSVQKHEEVGLYTVKDNIVTREEFYYNDGPFI